MLTKLVKKVINYFDGEIQSFNRLIQETIRESEKAEISWYFFKLETTSILKEFEVWDNQIKQKFLLFCLKTYFEEAITFKKNSDSIQRSHYLRSVKSAFIKHYLSSKPELSDDFIQAWLQEMINLEQLSSSQLNDWGISYFITTIKPKTKKSGLNEELIQELKRFRQSLLNQYQRNEEKQILKLVDKIDFLLNDPGERDWYFPDSDAFGGFVNESLKSMLTETRGIWFQLISSAALATGSKPSEKYLKKSGDWIDKLKVDGFREEMHKWMEHLIALPNQTREVNHQWGETQQIFVETCLSSPQNLDYMKSLVWLMVRFNDHKTTSLLSKLAERSYKKIPQKGPTATALGNACVFVLANQKGFQGIAELSRLSTKIKVISIKKLINKYLNENASSRGLSISELEDMACEGFNLVDGKKDFFLGEFTATIQIEKPGKCEITWTNPEGKVQVSIPQTVKEYQAEKLVQLKALTKQIASTSHVQKERFDLKMRSTSIISMDYFKENYLKHGILGWIARRCIWNFMSIGVHRDVLFYEGEWRDNLGNIYKTADFQEVQLWHPSESELASVLAWRNLIFRLQLQQPFKQAFREIYLLTDAERNTNSYSNRMAAHLLRQHQFVTLAKGRGWTANLLGAWDGGYDGIASIQLPEYNFSAEFWTSAVDQEDQLNESGIWNYLSTDQVRFTHRTNLEAIPLEQIPVRIFSEIMRDVDLFVGVSSVGNDPNWQDSGGLQAYSNYWHNYAFGDLGELSKNRKQLLEQLIPRLKIAGLCNFEGNFLKVRGKLRTYKIHIGSSNILMEPNDQYLCIVPDGKKIREEDTVYLPFEGDRILSLIISKAILLAADTKISDQTIVNQIRSGL
ncbi:MAG: DUF4132 domain-containing protein [Bacteroidia bacterium]|nr:DUF4132 domain-containing protein [Bacteroidia bacterium]